MNNTNKRILIGSAVMRRFSFSAALLLAGGMSGVAQAEGWFWQPKASAFFEQNDNVRLETTNPEDLASFGVAASGALHMETQDTKVSLTPGIRAQHYSAGTDLDSTDFSLDGSAFQIFERMKVGVSGRYLDSTTLTSEFEDSGNLRSRIERQNVTVSPSLQYKISPLSSVKVGASYTNVAYEDGVLSGYYDYEQLRLDGGFDHELSRRSTVSVTLYQTRFNSDDLGNEAVTNGAQLGVAYKLFEDTTLTGHLGGYSTTTDYTVGGAVISDTLTGLLYGVGVSHKARITTLSGSLGRKVQPSSTGEIREEDKLVLGVSRKLSQRIEGVLDATFLSNTYLGTNVGNDDRDYRSLGASLAWHLDPLWTLKATYRNAYQKYDVSADSASSNKFNISVIFNGLKKTIW